MKYSEERREAILRKLLPPDSRSVAEVAAEEGISVPTLYAWRKQARGKGRLLPDHGRDPEGWTSRDKFSAVVETAAMSEIEVAEYCRQRGLYPEQIQRWRRCCEHANERAEAASLREGEVLRQERKRNRELERELRRKEAALAETAALLTLRKKAAAIWGDEDA
jgi:transposase-like protein